MTMSHRTAAAALLLASSLPYGLARPQPQVIPFLSELDLGPEFTPAPLPSVSVPATSAVEPAQVTVVGTVVQAKVESAVGPAVVDPEASILPLILPGVLPVEALLPPVIDDEEEEEEPNVFFPDFDDEDLPDTNELEVIDLPPANTTLSEDDFPDVDLDVIELPAANVTDDLPDTNELEVIDLPAPNTTLPEADLPTPDVLLPGDEIFATPDILLPADTFPTDIPSLDDGLIGEPIPLFPDFPPESTVPISTFNAVVQPLLSVVQTLLNALPGNAAPALPDIFIHPLLPASPPDIFIDPILPTETLDSDLPVDSELGDPLFDLLVDPIPSSLLDDAPVEKRQAPVPVPLTTQGIFDLVASILQSINALVQAIPVVGPVVADIVDDVAGAVLTPGVEASAVPLPSPIDVALPDVLDNGPAVPLPLPLDVEFPDEALPEPLVLPLEGAEELPQPLTFPLEGTEVPPVDVAEPDPNVLSTGTPVPLPLPLDVEFPDELSEPLPEPLTFPLEGTEIPPVDVAQPDPNVLSTGTPIPLPLPLDVEFPDAPVEEPSAPVEVPTVPVLNVTLPILAPPSVSNITLPILAPPSPPLSEAPATELPAEVPDVAAPEPEVPSILPAPVGPVSDVPSEVLDIPFPDDIEGIDWAAFESPPFSDLPETPAPAEGDLWIPDDVLNVPVPDFDENGFPIDTPVEPASVVPAVTSVVAAPAVTSVVAAAGPAPLPTSLDAFGDFDFEDELPDWPFPEIPDVVAPDADGELPDLDDISEPAGLLLPVEAPTLALPTDLIATVPADLVATVPTDIVATIPTDLFDVPVPEGFEDFDFPEPTAVASILPAPPAVDEAADIPEDILNIPWPDLDENGFPIDVPVAPSAGVPAPPAALPTDLNWFDIPVPDDWVEEDDIPAAEAPTTVALPEAPPALPTDLNFLDIPVPDDFEELVDPLPTAILPAPAVEEPSIPEDILNIPVPDIGEDGLPVEEPAPALSVESFGDGFPIQALPDVPLVLPPVDDLLPVEGAAALTEAVSAVPTDAISGLPTSVIRDAFDVIPTVAVNLPFPPPGVPSVPVLLPAAPTAAPTVAAPAALPLVPRLPFQVPKPAEKRQLVNFLQPRPAVTRPRPTTVPGLQIVKPIFELISSLLAKLGVDAAQVPNLAAALSLAPTLPPVLPLPGAPTVSEIAAIVENVASVVDSVTSALPALSVASILPDVEELIDDLVPTAVITLPTVAPIRPAPAVLPAVLPAVALPANAGGARLARRAVEMQQGPASDWESFLGKLDESYQSELTGLIHDSAAAVNADALDSSTFASTLASDLEHLSASTKAQLVKGFASTLAKRSMRHGKRQTAIPGALSIGPNLDDARKVDLSSILGKTGSLDPFGQASPSRPFPGHFVDGARPDGIRPPPDAFDALPDSSVLRSSDPELAAILAAGGLDPNGMRDQLPPDSDGDDFSPLRDPYADIRPPWDAALDVSQPGQALEGLHETLQASRGNHIGSRVPLRSSSISGSSSSGAAPVSLKNAGTFVSNPPTSVLSASQDVQQRNVLLWFQRFVKPSWNKDVDAEIEIG